MLHNPDFLTGPIKVPQITLYFWLIKIMATTVGETAADFLNVQLGFGLSYTTLVTAILLAAALVLQFRSNGYTPWIYSSPSCSSA